MIQDFCFVIKNFLYTIIEYYFYNCINSRQILLLLLF